LRLLRNFNVKAKYYIIVIVTILYFYSNFYFYYDYIWEACRHIYLFKCNTNVLKCKQNSKIITMRNLLASLNWRTSRIFYNFLWISFATTFVYLTNVVLLWLFSMIFFCNPTDCLLVSSNRLDNVSLKCKARIKAWN